jgi:hypothetical protein
MLPIGQFCVLPGYTAHQPGGTAVRALSSRLCRSRLVTGFRLTAVQPIGQFVARFPEALSGGGHRLIGSEAGQDPLDGRSDVRCGRGDRPGDGVARAVPGADFGEPLVHRYGLAVGAGGHVAVGDLSEEMLRRLRYLDQVSTELTSDKEKYRS